MINVNNLSTEQQELIRLAKQGRNVLVDACIGSGKTTTIQVLCNEFPYKKILYLTYNKLLKTDAQSKIKNRNVHVQNYHGFAYGALYHQGITCGVSELIQVFNREKPCIKNYDMLVLDEYQDLEQELAEMLWYIKERNPYMQIIAVGDMKQKIYNKTTLNVPNFINNFLGNYEMLSFTKCFRLSENIAAKLGRVWEKKITGVNRNCEVQHMDIEQVEKFLSSQNPSDILCLGARTGDMSKVLNYLEEHYKDKFNKKTVYASIKDEDRGTTQPSSQTAIFTTFDSSKGLERPICVVFDFTYDYWSLRSGKPLTDYKILRNIFCVAASRGKEKIIFVRTEDKEPLTEKDLSTPFGEEKEFSKPFYISDMFDFKYKEDVEVCYSFLSTKKFVNKNDMNEIKIENMDSLIDLSPCIGIFEEANYFKDYNIDEQIRYAISKSERFFPEIKDEPTMQDKVLYLTMCETTYDRYVKQVKTPFISEEQAEYLSRRIRQLLTPYEIVQGDCEIEFEDRYGMPHNIIGRFDVLKNDIVYELKYVSELEHTHFLQAACYLVALGLKKARLWNIRNNEMYEITVPNKREFINAVVNCITKGVIDRNYDEVPQYLG